MLLGTNHSIQLGLNAPDEFRIVLINECEKNKVRVIAEEIGEYEVTIASMLAAQLQLTYLNADPGLQERMVRGIPINIPLEIMSQYDKKYPIIMMWPRDPNKDNLPEEVWAEYTRRNNHAFRMREKVWLEKIDSLDKWPLLFICGTDHFDPFSKLLKSSNYEVVETYKNWNPC